MVMELKGMTGEELLLASVLNGPKVQALVDRELDRRAIFGPLPRRDPRPARRWHMPEPRHAA